MFERFTTKPFNNDENVYHYFIELLNDKYIEYAYADLMADATSGKTGEEIREIFKAFTVTVTTGTENPALGELNALAAVSEFPSRIGCATLPWRALEEALQNV